jgi:hypothetical protein
VSIARGSSERLLADHPYPTPARSVVARVEAAHVAFLKGALGSKAVKKPTFNFKGTTSKQAAFLATAMAFEDTGVSAYAGAAPMITNKKTLAAALSVHSVEARHAAWVRDILGHGGNPLPTRFPLRPRSTPRAARRRCSRSSRAPVSSPSPTAGTGRCHRSPRSVLDTVDCAAPDGLSVVPGGAS